jgi:hypothetical protein
MGKPRTQNKADQGVSPLPVFSAAHKRIPPSAERC